MKTITCDVAVVGAGPAGLAAAEAAKSAGAGRVLIIERDGRAGGILQQCIHPGFGLKIFGEELTGPEYAERFLTQAGQAGVELLTGTTALELRDQELVCAGSGGLLHIRFGALVLAMGCREKTRANLVIPGSRPSGIYTAGTAQKLINIYGDKIGKEIVILGSGDIGMIMARRLTLEGAHVKAVIELMPFLAGLTRNKVQCLDDFEIPLLLSHTIVDIEGIDRLSSVTVCPVDENRRPLLDQQEKISCDTLLLSVGLIPENELSRTGNIELSPVTRGPVVNQYKQTSNPAVFACGNVLHVNDLVDHVSRESAEAGRNAALYAAGKLPAGNLYPAEPGAGIRYVCPQKVQADGSEDVTLYFRTVVPGRHTVIHCRAAGKEIVTKKCVRTSPGTMEAVVIPKEQAAALDGPLEVSCEHGEVLA
ncbi:MAG: FAD-dependent oxidoreductase [Clostridia bacterium]|nr:FAD-dependent oxidoreductase [Clostridia bacterium]